MFHARVSERKSPPRYTEVGQERVHDTALGVTDFYSIYFSSSAIQVDRTTTQSFHDVCLKLISIVFSRSPEYVVSLRLVNTIHHFKRLMVGTWIVHNPRSLIGEKGIPVHCSPKCLRPLVDSFTVSCRREPMSSPYIFQFDVTELRHETVPPASCHLGFQRNL